MLGALFKLMGGFAAPPPPGASPPPLWGSQQHLAELFGDRVDFHTHERDVLEITAFERRDYGEHFKALYGTDRSRSPKERTRSERPGGEFDQALDALLRGVEPRQRRRGPFREGVPARRCASSMPAVSAGNGAVLNLGLVRSPEAARRPGFRSISSA